MKNIFRASTLIAMLIFLCLGAAARTPGDKVGVRFEKFAYDFGTVGEDQASVVHEFTYTNIGSQPVAIISAKASCGCTTPVYDRKPLQPGKSARIKVTFIPRGQGGEVSKDVRIRFKNGAGKSEQVTLRMTGVVVPSKK